MWQRKNQSEIRRIQRRFRFSPLYAFLFAIFAGCVLTLFRSMGWRGYLLPPTDSIPLWRAAYIFPVGFAFVFVLLYVFQLVSKVPRVPDHDAMICDRCHRVTGFTEQTECECGGRLELLRHWTWVPDSVKSKELPQRSNKTLQPTAGRHDEQI